MRTPRATTWARLRVHFGMLLIALFALGGACTYASFLADPQSGQIRSNLRTAGIELIALSIIATVLAAVLNRRFSPDE